MTTHAAAREKASRTSDITVLVEERAWRAAAPDLSTQIRRAAKLALARAGGSEQGGVTVLLTSDSRLQTLNRQHRGKDKPTNVLSFPAVPGAGYLGDIALAHGVAAAEAAAAGKPLADHAVHLTVHGVLHLLGYDHERAIEADVMEALEIDILAELGIPDPYRRRGAA
jgi:probable rRNA maturation factor